jgi:hypothetical protein
MERIVSGETRLGGVVQMRFVGRPQRMPDRAPIWRAVDATQVEFGKEYIGEDACFV